MGFQIGDIVKFTFDGCEEGEYEKGTVVAITSEIVPKINKHVETGVLSVIAMDGEEPWMIPFPNAEVVQICAHCDMMFERPYNLVSVVCSYHYGYAKDGLDETYTICERCISLIFNDMNHTHSVNRHQ